MVSSVARPGAQDLSHYTRFTVDGKTIQFNGFVSPGCADSNDNNDQAMKTGDGRLAFTGGVNVSTQLTDKFRAGAQIYDRNIVQRGKWPPTLDWAIAVYRFSIQLRPPRSTSSGNGISSLRSTSRMGTVCLTRFGDSIRWTTRPA